MRINARLDEESDRKLTYLRQATHAQVTEVVKRAIDLYYREVRQGEQQGRNRLLDSGFVGCGVAEPDLSETYKAALTEGMDAKHGDR